MEILLQIHPKHHKRKKKLQRKLLKKITLLSDLIHVGFAQVGAESDWRLAQTQSMKQTFSESNGYKLDFVDCNNDQKPR